MKYIINLLLITTMLIMPTSFSWAQLAPSQTQLLPVEFVVNGGFENGKAGWVTYKNTAQALPVTGSGGTATSSFATSTSSPLRGKSSGVMTHTAANNQGEGISYSFTVDAAAKGKMLNITGVYQIISGTYNGAGTESDIEVYVYDVDAAQVIQPSAYKLDGGVNGLTYDINASFQTNISSTNYRLIFHYPNTTATAFAVKFDNISVGPKFKTSNAPKAQLLGTVTMTGCASYWSSSSTAFADFTAQTGCTYTTTGQAQAPSTMIPAIKFPSMAAGDYRLEYEGSIFANVVAKASNFQFWDGTNTARESSNISVSTSTGTANINGTGFSQTISYPTAQSNVTLSIRIKVDSGGTGGLYGTTSVPGVIRVWYFPTVSSQTNDLGSQRIVFAKASGTAAAAAGSAPLIVSTATSLYDTHGGYNSSTGRYTVPEAGLYRTTLYTNNTTGLTFSLFKNGVVVDICGNNGSNGLVSCNVSTPCVSGDLLDIRPSATSTASAPAWIQFEKIMGPSQIGPTETIAASYYLSASFSASSTIPINYDSKEFDTHNAVTTSSTAWKFTAPASGVYSVSTTENNSTGASYIYIYKNGTIYKGISYQGTTTLGYTTLIKLNAGEYIDIRPATSITVYGNALAGAQTTSSISILRVGL